MKRKSFFYDIIRLVKQMKQINNFEDGLKYKLYSSVEKIIHPTISKKNISSYKIVLSDNIVPVRIFYPEKVSHLDKVIIYVHGISSVSGCGNHYADICMDLALNTKKLVIAVDYDEDKKYLECLNDCSTCVSFLVENLEKNGIKNSNITLMGDSIGATMVIGINELLAEKINKSILVSPILSDNYFSDMLLEKNDRVTADLISNLKNYYSRSLQYKKDYKNPLVFPLLSKNKAVKQLLLITGEGDFFRNEILEYANLTNSQVLDFPFARHNFLKNMDIDVKVEFYTKICNFLNQF